jgi:hypothetical protein
MNLNFLPKENESKLIDLVQSFIREEFTLIRMTDTMLKKSIIDASEQIRNLLKHGRVVDFEKIKQNHKLVENAYVLTSRGIQEHKVSFYRPKTKNGDPRFWVYSLGSSLKSGTLVYFTIFKKTLLCIPLTNEVLQKKILEENFQKKNENQLEQNALKSALSKIKGKWIKSVKPDKSDDKDVGETLEKALGIDPNVDQRPDFLGKIEIKSLREKSKTRGTLFSQVPNWKISPYKSSKEIMLKFGYRSSTHEGAIGLYVTVFNKPNQQGLFLSLRENECLIAQMHCLNRQKKVSDVCFWEYDNLKKRLFEKHPMTLWVEADEKKIHNEVHFRYQTAVLTQRPIFTQFTYLVGQGIITYDWRGHVHPDGTKYRDHGHCWRIKSDHKERLFGSSEKFDF